jgi:Ser/Thr protein kinase RdoA (MazF antagonist)
MKISSTDQNQPPPAEGVRLDWSEVAPSTRAAVEAWLGSHIVSAVSQRTGFSPGVAARLLTADGRRFFLKAIGPKPNPQSVSIHRQEIAVTSRLPASAPVPRLLWSLDDLETGWVVLIFEHIDGHTPAQPWNDKELRRVLAALVDLSDALTPSPLTTDLVGSASHAFSTRMRGWVYALDDAQVQAKLDAWSSRHLDALCELEAQAGRAVNGDTLLNFDIRADNVLLTPDKVWIVDWPLACVGAAWVDVVFFAPSVYMQGGWLPEQVIAHHPAVQKAKPEDITAAVAAVAGFFTYQALLPPPPGLPTLRPFQAAQGVVAREWVAQRTGWR